jgi:hypothetical protein
MFSNGKSFDRLILLLIITVQAFLFRSFYHREIEWYPPKALIRLSF